MNAIIRALDAPAAGGRAFFPGGKACMWGALPPMWGETPAFAFGMGAAHPRQALRRPVGRTGAPHVFARPPTPTATCPPRLQPKDALHAQAEAIRPFFGITWHPLQERRIAFVCNAHPSFLAAASGGGVPKNDFSSQGHALCMWGGNPPPPPNCFLGGGAKPPHAPHVFCPPTHPFGRGPWRASAEKRQPSFCQSRFSPK